ncbi:MAG: hypothetical protein GC190_10400 [Alphaproteobacteria bacterium]|nr:hypothetical protein [Alphaproteobacteria bacterium]
MAAIAAVAAVATISLSIRTAFAHGASEAEALTEPSTDPYDFPNIELCCQPHHPRGPSFCQRFPDEPRCHRDRRRHHGGYRHHRGHDEVDVDCGAGSRSRHVFTSLQEAVEDVEDGGLIRVRSAFPGSGCVGNVVITKNVTIVGVGENGGRSLDEAYRPSRSGRPITAVVDGCISIWGPGRPRVTLRDIEILGTTSGYVKDCNPIPRVNEGSSGLTPPRQRSGANLFTALMIDGGTFVGSNVSVRSAGRAFFAEHSVVEITGGNFAAHPAYDAADAAMWLLRTQARLQGVSIAGGQDGVVISMLDRYPVTFRDVAILPVRTQVGGVYPEDGRLYRGKTGVRVKVDYEDLPSTADHEVAQFNWTGGTVHGYRQGIDVGPGVNGTINGVTIIDTKRATHFARGAQLMFANNKITGNRQVGIQIDPGAIGQAVNNDITWSRGDCICYGDECTRGKDGDFGGFGLHGNVCRSDSGRGRDYKDVGGDDW